MTTRIRRPSEFISPGALTMANSLDVMTLLALPQTGRETVRLIFPSLDRRATPPPRLRSLFAALKKKYRGIRVPEPAEIEKARREASALKKRCRDLKIRVLLPGQKLFPRRLLSIPHAPVILYARGDVTLLREPLSVAIVGTREPSSYGRGAAERLGKRFAGSGWVVVSGLAAGCDTAAHRGCLKAGGKTVAVLAHGLDRIYPPENFSLAEEIVSNDGCLVSEYPPGTAPLKPFFQERDRLQSGLSLGVLAVETGLAGGTVHTMHYAMAQHRVLGCLKHPEKLAVIPQNEGNREFLARGDALPVGDAGELEEFMLAMKSRLGL